MIGAGNGGVNTLYSATLAAGANSGVIATGHDMIIMISNVNPVTVRFGTTLNLSTATASDILLPGGVQILDMGHLNNAIVIYAEATTAVSVTTVVRN